MKDPCGKKTIRITLYLKSSVRKAEASQLATRLCLRYVDSVRVIKVEMAGSTELHLPKISRKKISNDRG
jgi:hypothetical protein